MNEPVIGGIYKHAKTSNFYRVLTVGTHTETQERMVVYHRLEGDSSVWIRPLAMFLEEVEINGKLVPRFQYVSAY